MQVRLFTGFVLLVCIALLASLVPGGRQPGSLAKAASPASPTADAQGVELVGHIDTFGALTLAVQGNYAYIIDGNGLRVVDVSTPTNPTEVAIYDMPARAVAAQGDYIYVTCTESGSGGSLRVFDSSTPSNLTEVGFYEAPELSAVDVAVQGDYIYITAGEAGLFIFRLQPSSISGQVSVSTPGPMGEWFQNPLEGVQIVAGTEYSATTDALGQYVITDVLPGTYTLVPTKIGYLFWPDSYTVTVPPDAVRNFTWHHIHKQVTASSSKGTVGLNDILTYTVRLAYPDDRSLVLYDPVPAYTTYISGSLSAPAGVVYDPTANTISGTLSLTAGELETVTFGVRVGVMGTVGFSPLITNRACVYPVGGGLADCEWSNEVRSYTYKWSIYLPLFVRSWD